MNYSDIPSPLSNVEKFMDTSHREEEFSREHEREEITKPYHERDPRMSSSQQRKGNFEITHFLQACQRLIFPPMVTYSKVLF